jgi:putative nucleotidyltransferase with HDIG domain
MLPKRVDNIVEAVKLVGLRGVKNLLYSSGTQKILTEGTKELWDHSYRTAYYAYNIAKNLKNKEMLDDAYVGGILHDIGKIIFSNIHPQLLEKITSFCREREISRELLEDISGGLNHAEIGGLIAEKWNFPESLIEAIRYHHEPDKCSREYRDVVYCVYLSNAICNVEEGVVSFELLNNRVLKRFNIADQDKFTNVQERLNKAFENERLREKQQQEKERRR